MKAAPPGPVLWFIKSQVKATSSLFVLLPVSITRTHLKPTGQKLVLYRWQENPFLLSAEKRPGGRVLLDVDGDGELGLDHTLALKFPNQNNLHVTVGGEWYRCSKLQTPVSWGGSSPPLGSCIFVRGEGTRCSDRPRLGVWGPHCGQALRRDVSLDGGARQRGGTRTAQQG